MQRAAEPVAVSAAHSNRAEIIAFVAMAAILIVAPAFVYPVFLMKALCFALFACAFNLLIGYVGLLSFGHALYFGWASYVCAHLAKVGTIQLPYWIGSWQFACLDYYRPPGRVLDCCILAEPFPPVLERLIERVEGIARRLYDPADVPRDWHLNTCLINFYGDTERDGKRVDTWTITRAMNEGGVQERTIPLGLGRGPREETEVVLHILDPRQPLADRDIADTRHLGIFLHSMTLTESADKTR